MNQHLESTGNVVQDTSGKPFFSPAVFDVQEKADLATEETLTTSVKRMSLSSFFGTAKSKATNANASVKGDTRQHTVVSDFLKKGEVLAAKHLQYEGVAKEVADQIDEQTGRGNKALYELLADVYQLALDIEQSAHVDEITLAMRDVLKEKHEINTAEDTPLMTIVVKLVVKTSNRQTASNYSRALRVAKAEGVAPSALADFIANQGGVSKTLKTAAQKQADAENKDVFKARTTRLRRLMVDLATNSAEAFKPIETETVALPVNTKTTIDDEKDRDAGDFMIFIGIHDPDSGQYRIGAGYDLGRPFEDYMLRHIAKRMKPNAEIKQFDGDAVTEEAS